MPPQVLLVGQAEEVEADHLAGPLGWFAAGVEAQEQAGDDRAVGLDLDPLLVLGDQAPAAEHVLEELEKHLDAPPLLVDLGDDLGGRVESPRQRAHAAR